jgi:nitric oxide reductase subunit B
MVLSNLLLGGVLQLVDVLNYGYWHARGPEFLNERIVRYIEWPRLPADIIFIVAGVIPALGASGWTYKSMRKSLGRAS